MTLNYFKFLVLGLLYNLKKIVGSNNFSAQYI